MRRVLRAACVVVVVVCLGLFFSFESGSSMQNGRQESWLTVGQPWPWYENRMRQELRPDGGHSASGEAGVITTSPAWAVLVVAIVALVAVRQLRSTEPATTPA
jgi:hypothetical protein